MGGRVVGKGSQAIALSAQASSGYYGCSFYGFQDTLLANKGTQYYRNCQITGATDFIFGQNAAAWFERCDIRVRNGGYYITGAYVLSALPWGPLPPLPMVPEVKHDDEHTLHDEEA